MFRDGNRPLHMAAGLQPRQNPTTSSSSSTISNLASQVSSPSSAITSPPSAIANATFISHAAYTTATPQIDLGNDICTTALPAGGVIEFNDTFSVYLPDAITFIAPCSALNNSDGNTGNATVVKSDTPFYASLSPQVYVLATTTIISYILVVLIFITPRTFYVGGPGTGTTGSGTGLRSLLPGRVGRSKNVIGIGRRPLLQKVAAISVAVSLTIATADTFKLAEIQYDHSYMESKHIVEQVIGSMEIRVTRIISDTFLWLAQVQTLIRLFPRHKEKVTIKWLGFGLVLCDTVFSILENFVSESNRVRPDSFNDAIPALSYLFELSISLIYASCVLYYALSKRRFAFWHAKMRNVCLVALLSIIAVLIPVVFFITDLAQPDIAGWGEYIRWVGAAAASVVVWEWVERIEALERDEKKDGILGREIFDGDEMLEMTASEDGEFPTSRNRRTSDPPGRSSKFWRNVRDLHVDIPSKVRHRKWKRGKGVSGENKNVTIIEEGNTKSDVAQIARPQQAATPISRSDTNSAASTVYQVRYHDPFSPSPAIPEDRAVDTCRPSVPADIPPAISDESTLTNSTSTSAGHSKTDEEPPQATSTGRQLWQGVSNPFKRKRTEPPAEVAAQITESNARRSPIDAHLNLRDRLNAFTASRRSKPKGRAQKNRTPLAVTVIPAQPRRSRVDPGAENAEDGATHMASIDGAESEDSDDENSMTGSEAGLQNLANLPVTVIPAPVRGGRTWSPDDIANDEETTPPARQSPAPGFPSYEPSVSFAPTVAESAAPMISQRGMLPTTDSPGRTRDINTPLSAISSMMRRPRNNRSNTVTSINDRLSSASPSAMAGTRSGTVDSDGQPRHVSK